jgi:hypothetical protein
VICVVWVEGETDECYISGVFIEVDCGDDDMRDGEIGLGYEGENGAGPPIWMVESLVVDHNSWSWWKGYGRHWGCGRYF